MYDYIIINVLKGGFTLIYALIGDLHSNIEDTLAVLTHIKQIEPKAKIIGLGDLYECSISKKNAKNIKKLPLHKAAVIEEEFEQLLTFPSIRGNQEERIARVTGIQRFVQLPEIIEIENATLMHGHQFQWDIHWHPTLPPFIKKFLFFGHSHECGIYQHHKKLPIPIHFGHPLTLLDQQYGVNVGSVVVHREWCLYNSATQTITFMKAL